MQVKILIIKNLLRLWMNDEVQQKKVKIDVGHDINHHIKRYF